MFDDFFLKLNCVYFCVCMCARYVYVAVFAFKFFKVTSLIIQPPRDAATFTTRMSNVGFTDGYVPNIDFYGV